MVPGVGRAACRLPLACMKGDLAGTAAVRGPVHPVNDGERKRRGEEEKIHQDEPNRAPSSAKYAGSVAVEPQNLHQLPRGHGGRDTAPNVVVISDAQTLARRE